MAQPVTVYHTPNGCALSYRVYTFYRRKAIYYKVREDLISIIRQLYLYKGVEIIEGHMMPDHIHMLVLIPPKLAISDFMSYLKSKSALMIFDKHDL